MTAMRRRITVALMAGLVVMAGAACGDDGGGGAASKPKVEVPDGDPPSELQIKDIKKGTGAEAVAGKTLTVHYVGVAWSDKKQFDSSWDSRGAKPFPFKLGAGAVIQGWDQGLVGMKVGGRRQLIIPPGMAYKEFGAGTAIKPNETLVFVVDLLDVT
jgi:peptidylprolyl isomerase